MINFTHIILTFLKVDLKVSHVVSDQHETSKMPKFWMDRILLVPWNVYTFYDRAGCYEESTLWKEAL